LDKDKNLLYIIGDATEDDTLKKAGILEAHGLMAVLSDDKDNLFITLTARQMNPSLRIVAKAVLEGSESKLISAGANTVVAPNRIGALRIVSEMVRPAVVTFLDQMLRESEQAIRFEEVRIPPGSKWIGKRIEALTLHKKSGISIIGLRSEGEKKFIFNPRPDAVLQPGMTLVVLGNVSEAHALQNLLN
jgi:voltage-gated potassium channel